MDDVNLLRQGYCVFRNLFLKLVKIDPFRQYLIIPSICNYVFLKADTVGTIPRGGIVWETVSLLKLFNGWCILVEQGTLYFMPEIEGRYICLGNKNVKVDGYSPDTRGLLSIWVVTGMDVLACLIGSSP